MFVACQTVASVPPTRSSARFRAPEGDFEFVEAIRSIRSKAPMASAAKKYAFRRRFDKHNYSLIGAELSDDDEDDGPVTEAMTAAAEAGLDAAALSHMEERDFNHVVKGGPARIAEYLGVRNHILTQGASRTCTCPSTRSASLCRKTKPI